MEAPNWVTVVVSAVASVVSTIAVFRSRLDVMDANRVALAAQVERDRQADKELLAEKLDRMADSIERVTDEAGAHFKTAERLMRSTLELVASLARQDGTDRRLQGGDMLARFVTTEKEEKK